VPFRLRSILGSRVSAGSDPVFQLGNQVPNGAARIQFRDRYATCDKIPTSGRIDEFNRNLPSFVYRASALHGQEPTLDDMAQL